MVAKKPRFCRITPVLSDLHWLPVHNRISLKLLRLLLGCYLQFQKPSYLCVLAYRCLHGTAPVYLSRYIVPVSSVAGRSNLRSASSGLLCVPASKEDCLWVTIIRNFVPIGLELTSIRHTTHGPESPDFQKKNSKPIFFQIQSETSIITLSCFYNL